MTAFAALSLASAILCEVVGTVSRCGAPRGPVGCPGVR